MVGFVLLAILTIRKVPGAILVGIIITAIVAFIVGTAAPPKHLVSYAAEHQSRSSGNLIFAEPSPGERFLSC